jgi:hypothetical protein
MTDKAEEVEVRVHLIYGWLDQVANMHSALANFPLKSSLKLHGLIEYRKYLAREIAGDTR